MKFYRWLSRLGARDWSGWPDTAYKNAHYQQRLLAVQERVAKCLDMAPPGPVRIISMCAGDGRDVIGVLRSHQRRKDVAAWLVELNRQSVAAGVRHVRSAGLENTVNFLNEDATASDTYRDIAPADIVVVCGVWGHVPPDERVNLVRTLASLCKPGGAVIWTRGVSKSMTRLEQIRMLFAGRSWKEIDLSITSDKNWAVVTHRYSGLPNELPATGRMFRFKKRCAA